MHGLVYIGHRQALVLFRTRCKLLCVDLDSATVNISRPSVINLRANMSIYRVFHKYTRGADKSLARPGRKQATATNSKFIKHTPHEA
jgi:hypothetical protein